MIKIFSFEENRLPPAAIIGMAEKQINLIVEKLPEN
jgi:hypothetical protein